VRFYQTTAQCLRSAIVVNGRSRSKAERGGLSALLSFPCSAWECSL
jgi:hypothetical protein